MSDKETKFQLLGSKFVKSDEPGKVVHDHTLILTDQDNNAVVVDMKEHFGKYKAEMFEPKTYMDLGLDPEKVFVRDHTLTGQMAREDAVVGQLDTID